MENLYWRGYGYFLGQLDHANSAQGIAEGMGAIGVTFRAP